MDRIQTMLDGIGLHYEFWGGYDNAERKIVKMEEQRSDQAFPIAVLCGKWDRFADISHRDILGSVMACGIERKCIGDILVDTKQRRFYLFCLEHMMHYLMQNIDRIGRCSVMWEIVKDLSLVPQATTEERRVSVSSERIDAVIAAVLHLSRQQAQDLIHEKKVFINHRLVSKTTTAIHAGDSVVTRGHGKFIYLEQCGVSKKGKSYILIKQYL